VSKSRQCEILGLSRTAVYYKPKGESHESLRIMKKIDKEHLEHPAKGFVGMTDFLLENDFKVGLRRVRRLMRLLGIQAVYRKRSLSTLGQAVYIKKYLLRGLEVDHKNEVWSIDITYIPMKKGFMYLTAIIDVYSRFIVGWSLHNTLDAGGCIDVLEKAIASHGAPEIINSDLCCQFSGKEWAEACARYPEMKVSMDGRGRAKDNIWIERFWKTIKYEYIYIQPEENGTDLFFGIKKFIDDYNFHRRHQGIGRTVPSKRYLWSAA
jgi:putative transposase